MFVFDFLRVEFAAMKKILIFSAFLFAFTSLSHAINGNELLRQCRAAELARPTTEENSDYTYCRGYVMGAVETRLLFENLKRQESTKKHFCMPDEMLNSQLVLIVVKFLHDNPDKLHWAAPALINNALIAAYPCK